MVNAELDLADGRIVPLKTTARFQLRLNWSLGNIDRKSIRAAEAQVDRAPRGRTVLVASHHPLVDVRVAGTRTRVRGRTRGGADALRRLACAGADGVLTGHVHTPFHEERHIEGRRVHLIGAGTLSQRLREHVPSFNDIRLGRGTIAGVCARTA
ncbi:MULTISPECIES: metallophosphoesterase family protein [Pacificimonas]|uniref:Calcineurin-like phosphoesterase domain-containing protein n=1 Tax=Pacificimonas aurantium TaxID=1250540 RepID=A0ABS7WJ91_9SPHN|nr:MULTISPECIES: hypothetical protein [Pacificimonas]MBZ6378451.1 hypothetical protein [Pacificimonas aurantium]